MVVYSEKPSTEEMPTQDRSMSLNVVVINPINVALPKLPHWLCKHPKAKILDEKNMIYECVICCAYGSVKVIADENTEIRRKQALGSNS